MASVFGIDFIRSTTGLLRSARMRKKSSRWGNEQPGYSRSVRHGASDDVGRLVEDEIIPRLLMVHQDDPRMTKFPADTSPTVKSDAVAAHETGSVYGNAAASTSLRPWEPAFDAADIREFSDQVLANEVGVLTDMIIGYLDRGIAPEALFIQLIAPAARELGERWTRDECDFVDVTMGLWRLQSLLRSVAIWAPPSPGWNVRTRKALFTAMPQDQHSLGTLIISECFQRAGWEVETLLEPQQSDIFQALSATAFDVVGLTVTTDFYIAQVPKLLSAMRSVSCNTNLAIMIGGPALGYDPELAHELGADGTAPDAVAALQLADELVFAGVERVAHSF